MKTKLSELQSQEICLVLPIGRASLSCVGVVGYDVKRGIVQIVGDGLNVLFSENDIENIEEDDLTVIRLKNN